MLARFVHLWDGEFKVFQGFLKGFSRFLNVFQGFQAFSRFFQGFSRFLKVFQGFSRFFKVFQLYLKVFKSFSRIFPEECKATLATKNYCMTAPPPSVLIRSLRDHYAMLTRRDIYARDTYEFWHIVDAVITHTNINTKKTNRRWKIQAFLTLI